MPDPADFISEEDWMAACVPERIDEGMPQNQAVASCLNQWRERGMDETITRAWAKLEIKAVDGEQRMVEGIATTPTTDRIGDVVEPEGAVYRLPLALLWQHQHDEPVGQVTEVKVSKSGIRFKAQIASFDEPGLLRDSLERAWHSVKAGLVRGVSIGFRAIERSFLEEGNGIRFIKWDWLELSLVTIPANAEATITNVKKYDARARAATGRDALGAIEDPGVTGGVKRKPVRLKTMEAKSYAEKIRDLENARAAKAARCSEILDKSGDEGRTPDESENEEFENLQSEIEEIDGTLKKYRWLEKAALERAEPVRARSPEEGSDSRQKVSQIRVSQPKLPPGIGFARFARARALSRLDMVNPVEKAAELYGQDSEIVAVMRAAVVAGTTGNWGSSLVGTESNLFADFAEFLRPRTLVGRFGTDGVPSLRTVPFRTRLVSQTGAGAGYWVGEAAAKPLTAFDFADTSLTPLKVASITVVSQELVRDSSPSAEAILRDQLVEACRARMDLDFIDPTKTAVANVSPASITNGLSLVTASGTTAADVRADVGAVLDAFAAADNPPENGVWIMSSRQALRIGLMQNDLGQPEFPGISMNGGRFQGLPVLTSTHVATAAVGSPAVNASDIYLVNASDIYFADEGGFMVDMSMEASLEMADNPTQEGTTPTASTVVSLWQNNLVGLRAERTINWSLRRASAIAGIDDAAYGT